MKKLLLAVLSRQFQKYYRRYFQLNHPKIVVVAGSVGKTGTKDAIATILSERFRTRVNKGNLNNGAAVPITMMGVDYPENMGLSAWLKALQKCRQKSKTKDNIEVIVQELGIDHPGEMSEFGRYISADIAVLTAITTEHMEYFKTIEVVALEELDVRKFSDTVLMNNDAVDKKYFRTEDLSYGASGNYRFEILGGLPLDGWKVKFLSGEKTVEAKIQLVGKHNLQAALAGAAVGDLLGMDSDEIRRGLEKVTATNGRMNLLKGINGSILIDDSYNSNPESAKASLEVLYSIDAPQRIAILGSMNELGEKSEEYHREVGNFLNGEKLAAVILVGEMAHKWFYPEAKKRVNKVILAKDAAEAGKICAELAQKDTVILAKGSQNGVYLEEAIKELLADKSDAKFLVRQSGKWLKTKNN